MEAALRGAFGGGAFEHNMGKMLIVSFLFHVAVFSFILFTPEPMPTRRLGGTVYEVNLVDMPVVQKGTGSSAPSTREAAPHQKVSPPKDIPTKRIDAAPVEPEKPVVIAKRTIPKKEEEPPRAKPEPARLLDQALTKIEKKVKTQEADPLEKAISRLKAKAGGAQGTPGKESGAPKGAGSLGLSGPAGARGTEVGIPFLLYQMEVENLIKGNWSYPVGLLSPDIRNRLEAIVTVEVKNDGRIIRFWFKKRSIDVTFDLSVQKAVERSDPLPPFPEGYHKTQDELEITFNLKDVEGD